MTPYELQIASDIFPDSSIVSLQSSIMTAFHAFNSQHLVTLGVLIAFCILISHAVRDENSPIRRWLGRLMGFALISYAVCLYTQQALNRSLSWEYSLPLELCNLVLFACLISLFWPNRWTAEIAYFWGLGGVLQAILTPEVTRGFPSWEFILFFWGHGATLLAIVFLIATGGFRPRKGNIIRMIIALNIYGLAVGTIDAIMGWNYGYLCRKPVTPSLLDFLGPWPWYLLFIEFIALLSFLLLDLPWRLLVLLRKRSKAWTVDV